MSGKLIRNEDSGFAEAVSRLAYCNPFLQERIELEKEALVSDFKDTGQPWNLDPAYHEDDPNIRAIVERAEALAGKVRKRIIEGVSGTAQERSLYRDLVLFVVYHHFIGEFDRNIRRAHEIGNSLERVRFYDRYQRELDHYFRPAPDRVVELDYSYGHLLAIGYQVRRAFIHIFHFLIGTSAAATRLRARIWQSIFTHDMARYQRALYNRMGDIITLITGPSGSGKEVVARAIGMSRYVPFDEDRRQFAEDFIGAFYPINLSALSPTLIESELFGHRKGAFTGALQDRKGYFEVCGSYGTVFLDEIGETDPAIQVKLLRVLQTRQFQRLGDTSGQPFEGKLMAATNRDLVAEIEKNRFREDFYYRLCADRIETPLLRDILAGSRTELKYLVRYIAAKVAGEEEAEALTSEVCEWVEREMEPEYPWPGNFRELEQCVRNVLVHREYHPGDMSGGSAASQLAKRLEAGDITAEEMLRQYVTRVYARTRNYEETARRLELDRRTVKKHIDETLLDQLAT